MSSEESTEADETPDLDGAVTAAWVHEEDAPYSWFHSMMQLRDHDLVHEARVWRGGRVPIRCGTDGLAYARNLAVKEFLQAFRTEWFWWIDTDMGFAPDTIDRLIEAADPVERPVMGALCFANRLVDNDGMGGNRALAAPVIMHWTHHGDEAGFDTRWDYPKDTVVRCDGVGAACVLIHRSVFERVQEQYGPNWYSRARNPSTGEMISEDLSFCARMMALEIPVHVHTGVITTHAKRIWLTEVDYWQQRAVNPPPVTAEQANAEAAKRDWTVPRYAIIPTHNRPARLLALVASLGGQCDHIVIVDNASTPPVDVEKLEAAAGKARIQVFRDEEQPPNLARFWNVMLDACDAHAGEYDEETWDVAILNDDSAVPAGWYDACSTGLRAHGTAVIAHTSPTSPALLTEVHNDPRNRMTPHAFVIRGELGLRADESMHWWYQDSDIDLQARQAGGVLSVRGPRVVNALANTTTVGPLAARAELDRIAFEKKWANR